METWQGVACEILDRDPGKVLSGRSSSEDALQKTDIIELWKRVLRHLTLHPMALSDEHVYSQVELVAARRAYDLKLIERQAFMDFYEGNTESGNRFQELDRLILIPDY